MGEAHDHLAEVGGASSSKIKLFSSGIDSGGGGREGDNIQQEQSGSNWHWSAKEKKVWFVTLLTGTTVLYACRTAAPLVAPAMAQDLKWTKTQTGTVLSSFFWGYTLTQVAGGYLSDKFSAERVLLASAFGWALVTFWFHQIVYLSSGSNDADGNGGLALIVAFRVLMGACQGVHFPAAASLTSKRLPARERALFFSASTGGSAVGMLLTGTLGSYLNASYDWPAVFYTLGLAALIWLAFLRCYAMEQPRSRRGRRGTTSQALEVGPSDWGEGGAEPLLHRNNAANQNSDVMPWLTYLQSPALWACAVCHYCQNNCFYILMSWLPTYFHDNFPSEKPWVFNLVPWVLMIPGLVVAGSLSNRMIKRWGVSVAVTRKSLESVCMLSEAFCLILIGKTRSYESALMLCMLALFAKSFHNFGCVANPMDISPKHSGTILGFSNTAAALSGFVGVYLAGYILELTGSWSALFNTTAALNVFGIAIFWVFGDSKPIV